MTDSKTSPYRSHADEYDALIGQTHDDMDYVDAVQRRYYSDEAGKHVVRMLDALLVGSPDFVPAGDLRYLLAEYQHIAAGLPIDDLASHETGTPARCWRG